jgi:dolichol kinase
MVHARLDPFLVAGTLLYIALLFLGLRGLAHFRPLSPFVLRKTLHVGIGAGTIVATVLFEQLGWALVAPCLFVAANAAGLPARLAPGIAREGRDPALWMFPLAVVALYLLYWNDLHRGPVLAGLCALGLADPAAAAVGRRFGERRFVGWGHGRTLEGSAAYLVATAVSAGAIALALPDTLPALRLAVGCGAAGALVEAVSPAGVDNLTAPLAVAAVFRALA